MMTWALVPLMPNEETAPFGGVRLPARGRFGEQSQCAGGPVDVGLGWSACRVGAGCGG